MERRDAAMPMSKMSVASEITINRVFDDKGCM